MTIKSKIIFKNGNMMNVFCSDQDVLHHTEEEEGEDDEDDEEPVQSTSPDQQDPISNTRFLYDIISLINSSFL